MTYFDKFFFNFLQKEHEVEFITNKTDKLNLI